MADADQVVVTIEPELPLVDTGEVVVKTEAKTEAEKTVDPVEDLKAQFAELQSRTASTEQARLDAVRQANTEREAANQARQEAVAARSEAVDSQLDTVLTGLDAARTEADSAQAEYQSAMEAGDFARSAKAQRRMASAEAKITRLDEAKADIEARKAQPQEVRREQVQQHSDPVEAFMASRTEPTKQWLRNHPEHARALALSGSGQATQEEVRRASKLNAADSDAIAEGLTRDSTAYFDHVERFIGLKTDEATKTNTTQTKRKAAPVAPVQSSGGGTSGGGNEVRLSAGEARAAQDGTLVWNYDDNSPQKRFKKGDPIGVQEFARRKQALTLNGQYDRTYTDS